ncbi:MAG: hypothetical protein BMS9Abin34_163 [Patescibacteria group bacterium]|nr:MAG: hypothetical protein BMS9Abin34_163 [Patescibacteria group bacterium]
MSIWQSLRKQKIPHLLHLLVLSLIFSLAVAAFVKFKSLVLVQFYVVTVAVLAYISWGVVYHFYRKRLSWSLFFEYFLVGALVIILFFWTLFA